MCKQGETGDLKLEGGRVIQVDKCLVPLLQALNDLGIPTKESCCGHGRDKAKIFFANNPAGVGFKAASPAGEVAFHPYDLRGGDWFVTMHWMPHEYRELVVEPLMHVMNSLLGPDCDVSKVMAEVVSITEEEDESLSDSPHGC